MKPRTARTSMLVVVAMTGTALAQDAIQWSVDDGGNGHWYQGVPGQHTWDSAAALAEQRGGYLATVTDAEEHAFLTATSLTDPDLFYLNWGPHIGGFQDTDASDFQEPDGGWRWITGEPFDWSDWGGCGPDNYGGNQNNLQYGMCDVGDPPSFNDVNAGYLGVETPSYLVEWSADCNGDGIVDYGQILDGTFEDLDGNGVPDCCENAGDCDCRVDLTEDGEVNTLDFLLYLGAWSQGEPIADWDGDGVINTRDFLDFLNDWVTGC